MRKLREVIVALGLIAVCDLTAAQTPAAARVVFNIPPQPLADALMEWSRQSGLQVLRRDTDRAGQEPTAPQVKGELSATEALTRLLANTALSYEFVNERTVSIRARPAAAQTSSSSGESRAGNATLRIARLEEAPGTAQNSAAADSGEQAGKGIPEILVKGKKGHFSLNSDIARTRDDIQPYVVFDREIIQSSGALNVEEFLRGKLTSSYSSQSASQVLAGSSNVTLVDLRGLGSGQTLILIDGRRQAPRNGGGDAAQPDLNGIPLAAIERIEILPTTASGIYGGGATGGVVNVILRRDYSGLETTVAYDGTFEGGGAARRVDFAGGMSLEQGRTSIMLMGSYSDADPLYFADRDFVQRGRAHIFAHNPSAFLNAATPPLSATTNIHSNTGAPLTLKAQYGGGSLGFPVTFVPYGYAGPASDSGAQLIANAGRLNYDLPNTAQFGAGAEQTLVDAPTVKSLTITARRNFLSWLDGFIDLAGSDNAGSFVGDTNSGRFTLTALNAANPFNQAITITTPSFGTRQSGGFTEQNVKAVAGLMFNLPRQWRAGADYTWNRARTKSVYGSARLTTAAANAVRTGVDPSGAAFNVFRDTNVYPVDFGQFFGSNTSRSPIQTDFRDIVLRAAGPLGLSLPAGEPRISAVLEHRKEELSETSILVSGFNQYYSSRWQSIDSAYLETVIPLISAANRIPGVRELELQIAARRDDYSITGGQGLLLPAGTPPPPAVRTTQDVSSIDPTFALKYQPIDDVTFRVSYGTGFQPPSLSQLVPEPDTTSSAEGSGLTDPRRGNEPIGEYTLQFGGNPDLRPEQSRSMSGGVILTPRFAEGLRVSADWVQIKKTDNTAILFLDQNTLDNELVLPGFITRGPPSDGYPVGPISIVNSRFLNVALQKVEAIDTAVDYRMEAGKWGAFSFSLAGTRNLHNVQQVFVTAPRSERVGLQGGGLKWQANGSVQWEKNEWTVRWMARYFDSYCILENCASGPITASQGSTHVSSQNYHDLSVLYRIAAEHPSALLADTEIRFGVRNIFNTRPPVDVVNPPYYSTYGDPRLSSYFLSLRKSFF